MLVRTLFWDLVLKDTLHYVLKDILEYDKQECAVGDQGILTFCPKWPFFWSYSLTWLKPSLQENIFSLFLFSCIFSCCLGTKLLFKVQLQSLQPVLAETLLEGGSEEKIQGFRQKEKQTISKFENLTMSICVSTQQFILVYLLLASSH